MIIAVVGPTGVGKTKMSIELAKKFNAIVVNCDAIQVYKELNVGSAKVTEEEKENIPHYLLDICEVNDFYTVYDYQKDLRKILDNNKDRNIVIVGGTGLYLKAGLFDYRFSEEEINDSYDELTNEELFKKALAKDPKMDIHQNNRKRLIRFLNKKQEEIVEPKPLYDTIFIGLTTNRDNLYNKINQRVDKMLDEGLLEEVKSLYERNINSKVINTAIGYKELYEYFKGNISLEESIDLIKQRSRKYAKRQYTWFNNQMDINWFDVNYDNFNETINDVIKYIEKNQ